MVTSRFYPAGERQTSHKAGSRSVAQKESGSRYADRAMPASREVAGAFGREAVKKRTKKGARRRA